MSLKLRVEIKQNHVSPPHIPLGGCPHTGPGLCTGSPGQKKRPAGERPELENSSVRNMRSWLKEKTWICLKNARHPPLSMLEF